MWQLITVQNNSLFWQIVLPLSDRTFSKHSSILVFKPLSYLKNNAFKKFIYFINHKSCGAVSVLPESFEFDVEQYVYVRGHMCAFLCSVYLLFQSDQSRRTLYPEAAYNLLSQWCFASLVSSETAMSFEIRVFLCHSFLCWHIYIWTCQLCTSHINCKIHGLGHPYEERYVESHIKTFLLASCVFSAVSLFSSNRSKHLNFVFSLTLWGQN